MKRIHRPGYRTPDTVTIVAVVSGTLGLALVANGLWIPAKAWLAQRLIADAWEETLAGHGPTRPWSWADTWPVARLVAPGASQPLYVLAGASGQSLAFGPAHVSASAPPGEPDNIVIAGHRDTHFAFLRDVQPGQDLFVETAAGTRHYRVTATQIVHESRTDLLERSGRSELTLITCFPFGAIVPGGPLRYVVHAEAPDGNEPAGYDPKRSVRPNTPAGSLH